ncbi:MAG: molybdopterin molybdotransferase MoeA [Oceanospirillaceae bacterium]|nr:molybdopterin molybdotransferase MoeA [Oceanospirillaceae bacterium]
MTDSVTDKNAASNADFKTSPLIPVADALKRLLEDVKPMAATEIIALGEGLNRVMASQSIAIVDVPPRDNSSMDGYAVALSSLNREGETTLPISVRIAAGDNPKTLNPGTVARIFTGANIPLGADAVIMQEQVTVSGADVCLPANIKLRQNIRPQGQDLRVDEVLFPVGKKLQPADLGVLASAGISQISVYKPLKVALLSTGDELQEPGENPLPGKIFNSNRAMLKAFIEQLGMQVVDIGKVADTLNATKIALAKAAERADLIISTGGVSVGEEDHIKTAVNALGSLNMWRIKLKPGKPLAYGRVANTPIFGLPGNPASAMITFALFARPYLLQLQGAEPIQALRFKAQAGFEKLKPGNREEYLRGIYADGKVTPFNNQSSGMLSTASRANGLIIVPVDAVIDFGDWVEFVPYSELFA